MMSPISTSARSVARPRPNSSAPPGKCGLAVEMCRNSYFNGEDVRLDGAIRMAPR